MRYQVLMLDVPKKFDEAIKERFKEMDVDFIIALTSPDASHYCKKQQLHLTILRFPEATLCNEFLIALRHVSYAPVIIFLDQYDVNTARSALQSGADLCVGSECSVELAADHTMAQFRRYVAYNHLKGRRGNDFQLGDIYIDPARCVVRVKERNVKLRPREFSLLLYFMEHPDVILSADHISTNAWDMEAGYDRGISQPIYLLRQAIEPNPEKPVYIRTVHRLGYRFTPESVEKN